VFATITSLFSLPGSAQLLPFFGPECLVDSFGDGVMFVVPGVRFVALDGAVWVTTKTYHTAGEWGIGVAKGSGSFGGSRVRQRWWRSFLIGCCAVVLLVTFVRHCLGCEAGL